MKRLVLCGLLSAFVFIAPSCIQNEMTPDQEPERGENTTVEEYVEFCANVPQGDAASKVSFDYTTIGGSTGMFTRWDGDEQMDVYIKSGSAYTFAGRIPAVEGSLSDDRFSISFAGMVQRRQNPETESFVFVYTNGGASYDWTKQNLDMAGDAGTGAGTRAGAGTKAGAEDTKAGADGTGALKNYSPMVFEADENGDYSVSNKACYIKFTASGLSAGVKVKSLSIYSPSQAVFPKTFDLNTFDYQADNKSKTLSYAFDNLSADASGNLTIFLAAPIVPATDAAKDYQIHIVTEDSNNTISTLNTTGITSKTAFSESKLYRLTRNSFTGATNPAATVGQTQGGSQAAEGVVIESIVGQWDKTGYLSNDIYGVLDMGRPEHLTYSQNLAINAIHKIYNQYFNSALKLDTKVHAGAVEVAGKAGQNERVEGLVMSQNGPQYVDSYDNTGTFNNIVLKKETEVYMTFIDSKAWNTNTIGYYCYKGETDSKGVEYSSAEGHKEVHDLVVFPSTSQSLVGENILHKFEAKTTAQLLYPSSTGVFSKKFPAGTTIGVMERVNALEEGHDFALKSISDASPVHYTNIAWNKHNTLSFCDYWNQIAVLKFKMPGDSDFNRHGLIYAMKDKYAAHSSNNDANWSNPIILIYTSVADAIDFDRSAQYWTKVVNMTDEDAAFTLSYDLDAVTSSKGSASINLTDSAFSDGYYVTTLKVGHTEFGEFKTLKVTIGERDVTEACVTLSENNTVAEVRIAKTDIIGNVRITAHAAKEIWAQSLTAQELLALAEETGDLPAYRLILHCSTASSGSVAFGMNRSGSYCMLSVNSPIYNAAASHVISSAAKVKVADEYNDYEWSLEKAVDGQGQFIGFKLKRVTKITDTEVNVDGYLTRAASGTTYATMTDSGTVLTAEQIGSGYEMYLKSSDASYQYLTCAFGANLRNAVFWVAGSHPQSYGRWQVYKVWLQ